MRALAEDDVQAAAVLLKPGLFGVECLHLLFGEGKQLGREPGRGAGKGNPQRHYLAGVVLVARFARVLVALALGVVDQLGKGKTCLVVELQVLQQVGRRGADFPLVRGELRRQLLRLFKRCQESFVVFEDAGKIPAVLLGDFFAGRIGAHCVLLAYARRPAAESIAHVSAFALSGKGPSAFLFASNSTPTVTKCAADTGHCHRNPVFGSSRASLRR